MSKESATEVYEARAARFYEETGMVAPGKDDALGRHSRDERVEAWILWCTNNPQSRDARIAELEAERDAAYAKGRADERAESVEDLRQVAEDWCEQARRIRAGEHIAKEGT